MTRMQASLPGGLRGYARVPASHLVTEKIIKAVAHTLSAQVGDARRLLANKPRRADRAAERRPVARDRLPRGQSRGARPTSRAAVPYAFDRHEIGAARWLYGRHAGCDARTAKRAASVPSGRTRYTSLASSRRDSNAIHAPSGEKRGAQSSRSGVPASRRWAVPFAFMIQISP